MIDKPNAHRVEPPVLKWFHAYCILMAVVYLLVIAMGVFMLVSPGTMAEAADDEAGLMFEGTLYLLIGIVLCIPFAITPLLPAKPWVWIYGIVLIAIGMTSACCLPATIPLLVFWIKPEVKSYFGRES